MECHNWRTGLRDHFEMMICVDRVFHKRLLISFMDSDMLRTLCRRGELDHMYGQ